MTLQNLGFFISGMAAGAMCLSDIAMILFVSAGFWRWGAAVICAVLAVLNIVAAGLLIAYGADPLIAALSALKVNIMAGVVLLPIAAVLAWICGKFWRHVGGLHAR